MPTNAERQALAFLAAVALVGGGVRLVGVQRFERDVSAATTREDGSPATDPAQDQLLAQIDAVDSAQHSRSGRRNRRKTNTGSTGARKRSSPRGSMPTLADGATAPSPDYPLNVNDATAEELERLPRVGPALARRILARRDSVGSFSSIDDLRHVRGIGTVTAALLAPLVTFDGRYRPLQNGSQRHPDVSRPHPE